MALTEETYPLPPTLADLASPVQPALHHHGLGNLPLNCIVAFPEVTEHLLADKVWPEAHPAAGKTIMLRDYQVEAITRYLDNP